MKNISVSPYVPDRLEIEEVGDNCIRLTAYPFEQGYAVTVAHPLRRLLLSSTVGYAPTAIKIEGVNHEFESVHGVTEDVAPLIANIKNLKFRVQDEVSQKEKLELSYTFEGPLELKGGNLSNEFITIIDEDSHVASITGESKLQFSLVIQRGLGYVPSEELREETDAGYIALDAFFTPVKRANYRIETFMHAGNPNFEKVVFEIETNGQVSPKDAFHHAIGVMHSQISVFGVELSNLPISNSQLGDDKPELKTLLASVDSLNLEHRPSNCLQKANIKYVGELALMSESELRSIKNLGRKSLEEISNRMSEIGYPIGESLPGDLATTLNKRLAKLKEQN